MKPYRVVLGNTEVVNFKKEVTFALLNPNSDEPFVCASAFRGTMNASIAEIFKQARPYFVREAKEDFKKFMHSRDIGEPPSCLTEITIEELE